MASAPEHIEFHAQAKDASLSPLRAAAAFFEDDLALVRSHLEGPATASLTIIMPPASTAHRDWRQALAGDLAREYAPARVNIAAGHPGAALDALLGYLKNARAVTGHYVEAHED